MSFKVIDVDMTKKLVNSACYNMQHICKQKKPYFGVQGHSRSLNSVPIESQC